MQAAAAFNAVVARPAVDFRHISGMYACKN